MPDFLEVLLEAKGGKKAAKAKAAPKPKDDDDEEDDAPTDYGADDGDDDSPADDSGDDSEGDAGDEDTPTDYSADEVDVDPNETGDDTGSDDADAGDDTGDGSDDATDYSDDPDAGDDTGDDPTDYSDDGSGDNTGGDPMDGGDGTEADAGPTPEQQAESAQNHDLLNDFINLYYTCKNTVLKLSNLSKDNITINKIVSQVMTNLQGLKNMLYDYIIYTFANSKYVGNLYKYGLFTQAFKINLEMLKKISVLLPN